MLQNCLHVCAVLLAAVLVVSYAQNDDSLMETKKAPGVLRYGKRTPAESSWDEVTSEDDDDEDDISARIVRSSPGGMRFGKRATGGSPGVMRFGKRAAGSPGVMRFGKRMALNDDEIDTEQIVRYVRDAPGVMRFGKRASGSPGVMRFGKRAAAGSPGVMRFG